MFRWLGDNLSRWWPLALAVWLIGFVALRILSPSFDDVAKHGEFAFLPDSMDSRQAENLLARAFPDRKLTSNIVVVVSREEKDGLTDADRSCVTDKLTPELKRIRDHWNGTDSSTTDSTKADSDRSNTEQTDANNPEADKPDTSKPDANKSDTDNSDNKSAGSDKTDADKTGSDKADRDNKKSDKNSKSKPPIITDIHDLSDRGIGALLTSEDKKATLVTVELPLDFQDLRNWGPVREVENAVRKIQEDKDTPKGLQFAVTGSATLGRDLTEAQAESARKTGPLTITLVIILLAVIYRAPFLALIPLATIFLAVGAALNLLTILGSHGYVPLFEGLQEYTTVLSYGPGVDYCLFLIARYKENIRACEPPKVALSNAIGQVGPAILASAATVICGIGMLTFAQFGKFHDAGIGISVALLFTLIAVLTLTPALLFMVGHWAFWPKSGVECDEKTEDGTKRPAGAVQSNFFQPMWTYMGGAIERHPLRLLLLTAAAMAPFVVVGFYNYGTVNYGLVESLPKSATSALGARTLEKHFASGITGPIQVLLQNSKIDFSNQDGIDVVKKLVDGLMKRRDELKIADIRSVANPLGSNVKTNENESDESTFSKAVKNKDLRKHAVEHFVSSSGEFNTHLTELDVTLATNPFAMDAVDDLDRLMTTIGSELPSDQRQGTSIFFLGPTASVRDLNIISHSDQWRIDLLVVSSVLVILMILLRTVAVSIYLLLTVLMSYIATLGVTWLVFYSLDPHGFIGLDWTVPLFLFVVLIAVGEDYNIFLITRVREEQHRSSPRQGIVNALSQTGGIITSCGFIMAGTFSSLCPNPLVRMQQLGFALAFGVLLDTFIVRPILVPAFLMVMNSERLGKLSRHFR